MRARCSCARLSRSLAGAVAVQARADGDPASDYLITQPVFFPYDGKFSPELEATAALALVEGGEERRASRSRSR